jgi:alkanesulfonate monooxygenase SsuD/methylene tetrahydromethanopterin reductase-like flavin-dependent oxidoreductase (luciferase family)
VPAGETLSFTERRRIERAVRTAERSSGLAFSVFLGVSEEDSRAYAERLHAALDDPARSVLVLCDPTFRALEIVTGAEARRTLDDVECRLAAASMESSFAGGDIVGGVVLGIHQLGEASRAPRTLHANN